MAEPIRINPDVLREVAGGHDDVARMVEAARQRGADILAAVQSYGPIMHEVKAAVSDLLAERDTALAEHASRHRNAGTDLRVAAHTYTDVDDQNAEQIRQV
jgi:Excreted virulence factor EspC, type VII ESX diderm